MRCRKCGRKIPKNVTIFYLGKQVCSTECFDKLKYGYIKPVWLFTKK